MAGFYGIKKAGWLAVGVAIAYLQFDVFASMIESGVVSGGFMTLLASVATSCVIGGILCCRSSARDILVMGVAISSYLPFFLGLLWIFAVIQDLIRNQGFPGASVLVMQGLPPLGMLMGMMVIAGVATSLSGITAHWLVRRIRGGRGPRVVDC